MSEVKAAELNQLCADIRALRAQIEEEEAKITPLHKRMGELEMKAGAYLDELGQDKFQSPVGTIYMREAWKFNLPKDEARQAFFAHLKERGIFDTMVTVNANTFNSYCNEEWSVAQKEGRAMEFTLPGIPEPTLYRKAVFLKGKS